MLQQTIDQDIKTAMLAKDNVRLRGLRAIKAALLNAKTEKGAGDTLTEEVEVKVLQRLVKQRKESADIYSAQNRPDLEEIEKEELEVIEAYLPKQMDRRAIQLHVQDVIARSGATSPKDMGKVMGLVNKELAGKADGKAISEVVKELLADFKQQKIQSTLIDFPLGVKVKSDRRKNFRAYFLAGAKYSIDIVSKKKTNDAGNVFTEKFVKNNRNILWYEAGIGLDLYFEFFKLSPEIKLANSVQSVLQPENHPYSAPIDKLFLRNLQFSLYFE